MIKSVVLHVIFSHGVTEFYFNSMPPWEFLDQPLVTVPVSIPMNELDVWTISTLHEYIFSRMGLENNCDHILVVGGTIMKRDSLVRLTECSFITDGCKMALTIV